MVLHVPVVPVPVALALSTRKSMSHYGSKSDPEVSNGHCPPRRSSRPPRRATEHAGGRTGHPPRSAGGNPVDSWRPVIRITGLHTFSTESYMQMRSAFDGRVYQYQNVVYICLTPSQ